MPLPTAFSLITFSLITFSLISYSLIASSLIALPMRWLSVSRVSSLRSSAGRLRWLVWMPVGTKDGHSTWAKTWSLTSARSWCKVSLSATTACLLTL